MLLKPFKYNPNYHSGKFNKKIMFQVSDGTTVNENGFEIENWQDVKDAWAMIKTLKGSEYFEAATTQNENISRFAIRYTAGLHPDMRIMYKLRPFEIESIVNDDEDNKTMTIMVKEVIV